METQQSLFADLASPPTSQMPPGFRYQEDIITEAEEADILASLATLDLKPFDFYGYLGNRRVTSFGVRYNYVTRSIEGANEFPSFLQQLRRRVAASIGRSIDEIQQGGVNQYPPGAGIGWHVDKPPFGVVVVVSLVSPATLRLRKQIGPAWQRRSFTVAPRSMYILDGEARAQWEHSIPPVASLRYSLTFRTLIVESSK